VFRGITEAVEPLACLARTSETVTVQLAIQSPIAQLANQATKEPSATTAKQATTLLEPIAFYVVTLLLVAIFVIILLLVLVAKLILTLIHHAQLV
jgi:hypothetical protein